MLFCGGTLVAWPMMRAAFFDTLYEMASEDTREQALRIANLIQQDLDSGTPQKVVLDRFQYMLENSPQSHSQFVCIVEGQDRVIAHPNPSNVGKDVTGWTITNPDGVVPYSYPAAQSLPLGGTQTRNDGSQNVIFQAPINGVPWSVCVHVAHDRLSEDTLRLLQSTAQISLPWVIVLVIVATALVRVFGGRFERELADANAGLEERVRERTGQLVKTNLKLGNLIQEERRKVARNVNFLANVSHELRTPLNSIKGFTEFLSMEPHGPLGDPRYQNYLRDVQSSSDHLLGVLNNVLELSKLKASGYDLSTQWMDLATLVNETVMMNRPAAEAQNVCITVDGPETKVDVDPMAFRRVLINLLSNAIKFSHQRGNIRITWLLTNTPADTGRLILAVEDEGVGISEADLERVLRPFEQAKAHVRHDHQGTGLGLPIANSLVELHGGHLTVESDQGRGTKVTVSLPSTRVS